LERRAPQIKHLSDEGVVSLKDIRRADKQITRKELRTIANIHNVVLALQRVHETCISNQIFTM